MSKSVVGLLLVMSAFGVAGCTDAGPDPRVGWFERSGEEQYLHAESGADALEIELFGEGISRYGRERMRFLARGDGPLLELNAGWTTLTMAYDDEYAAVDLGPVGEFVRISDEAGESASAAEDASRAEWERNETLCETLQAELDTRGAETTSSLPDAYLDTVDARRPPGCTLIGNERGAVLP